MAIRIDQHEIGLHWRHGAFVGVLQPGMHWVFAGADIQVHDLNVPEYNDARLDLLLATAGAQLAPYLQVEDIGAHEIGIVYKRGRFAGLLPPGSRQAYWRGLVDVRVDRVDLRHDYRVADELVWTFARATTQLALPIREHVQFVEVPPSSRGLVLVDGRCVDMLPAGMHAFWKNGRSVKVEAHDLGVPEFQHPRAEELLASSGEELARHVRVIDIGAREVGIAFTNGQVRDVLAPGSRHLYWNGPIDVRVERVDIGEEIRIRDDLLRTFVRATGPAATRIQAHILVAEVPDSARGLLVVDGRFAGVVPPGLHGFWRSGRSIGVEVVEGRLQTAEVSGQEILTRDKVSLRINLMALWQVTDAVAARAAVANAADHVYKELQFALRKAVGTRTLDELLADKDTLDREIAAHVRNRVEAMGLGVHGVGVKDVILPGEMKAILNRVVEADKVAPANLIRRREETAATRSLLNTARLMDENPTLLRLKELETLEKVTEKIDKLTVFGGLEGVLKDVIRIGAAGA